MSMFFLLIMYLNYKLFFYCRKREEEKKREVLTNPVKMKKIKEMVKSEVMFCKTLKAV